MHTTFEVQGHRGARGLLPENTLPGFELALDLGVTSIETDVFLTCDEAVVLFHDPEISERVCTGPIGAGAPPIATTPLVRSLTLQQLRGYRIDGGMKPASMPLAERFAHRRGIDAYGIPTLTELFDFTAAYGGALGAEAGKTDAQQKHATQVIFDIELKRFPFRPEVVADGFNGSGPALLERRVVEAIAQAGVSARTRVRSFDHRSVAALKQVDASLCGCLLTWNTVPAQIGPVLAAAQAEIYCPDYLFVDAEVVRQVHATGKRIIPYTVNDEAAWEQLVAWGVDGVTTDFPDRLLSWLDQRGIEVR